MSCGRVWFSIGAAAGLRELGRRREMQMRRELGRVAASAGDAGLIQARTPLDVAACEVLEDGETVLVYAVCPKHELLATLLGEEIHRRVMRRRGNRLLHWRFY